ncbi:MAG TPA: zf-HC2 domain-containing protein [Gemmatimonadaceae bacterium]
MSDCTNVEIRELLPEYLHGRLDASARSRVEAHLRSCTECAGEATLLRSVREAYALTPAIDTAAIVRKLPPPVAVRPRSAPRLTWLRVAAVVSFVSVGGLSLVALRDFFAGDQLRPRDSVSLVRGETPSTAGELPVISFGVGVSDLGTDDLEALLAAVESMEAAPPPDPDEFSLSADLRGGS